MPVTIGDLDFRLFSEQNMIFSLRNMFLNRRLLKKTSRIKYESFYTINGRSRFRLFEEKHELRTSVVKCLQMRTNSFITSKIQPLNHTVSLVSEKANRSYSSEDDIENIVYENVDDLEDRMNNLRIFLYPNSNDPIILQLNETTSVQQVFDIVEKNCDVFNADHCGQTVLVLWDLQRQCRRTNEIFDEVYLSKNELFMSYINQMKEHKTFSLLLDLLGKHLFHIPSDGLSCSLLYLTRMGINHKHDVVEKLILRLEDLIDNTKPGSFPVTALSRFILSLGSSLHYSYQLRFKISLTKTLAHVKYLLDNCHSMSEFKLLTICMLSLYSVISEPILEGYHNLTRKFIETNLFSDKIESNVSAIIKSISLLNTYSRSPNITFKRPVHGTIVDLMKLLIGNLDKLTYFQQFLRLQRVFISTIEPATLEDELRECCSRWVEKSDVNENELSDIIPDMFYCLVVNTAPYKQYRFTESALQLLRKTNTLNDLLILSGSNLRQLNLSAHLWPKMLNKLSSMQYQRDISTVFSVLNRYIDFSTYTRDKNVEREMMDILVNELKDGSGLLQPSKLAQAAQFILSFPEHLDHDRNFFEMFVQRLLTNMHQFKIHECNSVSRGFSAILSKSENVSHYFHHYVKLDTALTARSFDFLEEDRRLTLNELNLLLRALIFRNGSTDSDLFQKIIERYEFINEDELSSRSIRNTIYNLNSTDCLLPDVFDKFCEYVVKHHDDVLGSTVSKLLHVMYMLGHVPANESFLEVANDIIMRSMSKLSGFVLLQAALSLSFYNNLDLRIIKHIFSIEFLDQLDTEIKHGYSKLVYPIRIRKCLMELNRSVCLDYPEARVPWFHAKFCEQEYPTGRRLVTPFSRDVYDCLTKLDKDNDLIKHNAQSLYGHNIDFQFCLDKNQNMVQDEKENENLTKISIILHKDKDFTCGVKRLKGPSQMELRHLEMLGYCVITIKEALWNSMYMSEPKAKQDYLNDLIKQCTNYSIIHRVV